MPNRFQIIEPLGPVATAPGTDTSAHGPVATAPGTDTSAHGPVATAPGTDTSASSPKAAPTLRSAPALQIGNARFQNALRRIPQRTPPIWLMRQAGRYHRHYQDLRRQFSFMDLCKQPDLAARVALGPVFDFDFDAASLFSDLLFPLEALGMGLEYTDAGPQLGWQLDENSISNLRSMEDAWPHLLFQGEAMRATRERIPSDRSLIGFVGGPWTLFVYAVEGTHKGSRSEERRVG